MPKRLTSEERDARRAKNEAILAERKAADRAEKIELVAGIIASRDNVPWNRDGSGWPEALAETIIDKLWEAEVVPDPLRPADRSNRGAGGS